MLKLHSPLTGDTPLRLKSGRKPLQPKNTEIQILIPKNQKQDFNDVQVISDKNKENQHQETLFNVTPPARKMTALVVEALDASLAEELSAIRKKMERVRLDREKTEKMLGEREKVLDFKMKEMEERGLVQKILEMEVDRLFRLKELHSYSYSMRISPIRSLREKEHGKKSFEIVKDEESEESTAEATAHSPCSSSNSNSVS